MTQKNIDKFADFSVKRWKGHSEIWGICSYLWDSDSENLIYYSAENVCGYRIICLSMMACHRKHAKLLFIPVIIISSGTAVPNFSYLVTGSLLLTQQSVNFPLPLPFYWCFLKTKNRKSKCVMFKLYRNLLIFSSSYHNASGILVSQARSIFTLGFYSLVAVPSAVAVMNVFWFWKILKGMVKTLSRRRKHSENGKTD